MKKRLFAGALALLMIIGLLPVSSMLKKPVEAQAAVSYKFNAATANGNYSNGTPIGTIFTVHGTKFGKISQSYTNYGDSSTKIDFVKFGTGSKFTNNVPTSNYIEVKPTVDTTLSIEWTSSSTGRSLGVYDSNGPIVTPQTCATSKNKMSFVVYLDANKTYYVANGGSDVQIREMIASDRASYTVAVNDSSTEKSEAIKEGATFTYTAANESEFDYWKNSNGQVVARTAKLEIPVYYSDTYTAVYKKTGVAKVTYLTPYGGVLETHYKGEDFNEPEEPIRYGYTNNGWSYSLSEVVSDFLDKDQDVTVEPKYKNNEGLKYEINIDTTDLGGKEDVNTYVVNTEVMASIEADDFGYWADAEGNVLSYNQTYYFLANRSIKVVAVKKPKNYKQDAVITKVEYNKDNKTVIFEYTIPNDYNMVFAGVLASTNEANVNNATINVYPDGVYKLGANEEECANYKTFRYTLKSSGLDTWYVKPVLTYSDGTDTTTKYGDIVTMD